MSSIQIETTASAETVSINDMILRLDALAQGYEEILSIAKTQLENYEISDSDWNRLAKSLEDRINYRLLSIALAERLSRGLANIEAQEKGNDLPHPDDGTFIVQALIERLETILRDRLYTTALKEEVGNQVRQVASELRQQLVDSVEQAADIKFQRLQREALNSAYQTEHLIKDLMHKTFNINDAVESAVKKELAHQQANSDT